MASPASTSVQEKYFLLITGDIDCQAKLMSGLVNGFPQLSKPDFRFRQQFESNQLIKVDDEDMMLEVYKIEERFVDLSFDYQYEYCRANGIMILYDVTDEDSLDDVFKYSMKNLELYLYPNQDTVPPIMLVGTNIEKKDQQVMSIERLRMRAQKMSVSKSKLRVAEANTVTGENVETALQTITRDMIANCIIKSESELRLKTKPKKKQCVVS